MFLTAEAAIEAGGLRALAGARLLRAYSTQVEVLRRLRHGGHQYVRVGHVNIHDGGQAVIGNVKTDKSKASQTLEHDASGGNVSRHD
jgi:hypothetical protein